MKRPARSFLVTWLIGAGFGALVTLSFEALSARPDAPAPLRCPVTGAVADDVDRCPVTGADAAEPSCPASGANEGEAPSVPHGRCPAAAPGPALVGLSV